MRRLFAAAVLFAGALVASCVGVGDGRAARDLEVGHARAAGVAVDVDDGLSAVRALAPGRLDLRANAPALRFTLTTGTGGPFTIRVQNALSDARLSLQAASQSLAVVEGPSPVPTEKVWTTTLAADVTVEGVLDAPDVSDLTPWRFAVFGDVQDAIDRVQDIYTRMNTEPGLRFVVMVGDLTERGGEDELERFTRELATLRTPVYTTLGNHELGQLGDDDLGYHRWFGRGSSRFVYRGVQFTLLDSASATIAPQVYEWLEDWLAEGADRAHVVGMHIPPIDPAGLRSGSFASRSEADKLLARLARGNVDLTVYGHVHSYYAFANAGIPAFITGGGGAIPERMDGIGRHFLVFDVDPRIQRFTSTLVRVDLQD